MVPLNNPKCYLPPPIQILSIVNKAKKWHALHSKRKSVHAQQSSKSIRINTRKKEGVTLQHCALFRRQRDEEGERRVVVVIKKNSTIRVEMQVSRRRNSQVPGVCRSADGDQKPFVRTLTHDETHIIGGKEEEATLDNFV